LHQLHHGDVVTGVGFNSDSSELMTVSLDRKVRWWDVRTGAEIQISETGSQLYALAVSPDGASAVTGELSGRIAVWDVRARKVINSWFHPAKGGSVDRADLRLYVSSIAFAPDGKSFVAATANSNLGKTAADRAVHFVRSWGVDGKQKYSVESGDGVGSVDLSANEGLLAIGGTSGSVRVVDVPAGAQRFTTEVGGMGRVRFSPDGKLLIAHAAPGTLQVWDVAAATRLPLGDIDPMKGKNVTVTAFIPKTSKLVCGVNRQKAQREGAVVTQYDLEAKTVVAWSKFPPGLKALAVDDQGRYLAQLSTNGKVATWDLEKGRLVASNQAGSTGSFPASLRFLPGGGRLLGQGQDGANWIFDPLGVRKPEMLKSGDFPVCVSDDGRWTAAAVGDGIEIAERGVVRAPRRWNINGRPLKFTPDANRLIVECKDVLEIVDVETGKSTATIRMDASDLLKERRSKLRPAPSPDSIPLEVALNSNGSLAVFFCGMEIAELWSLDGRLVKSFRVQARDVTKRDVADLVGDTPGITTAAFHPTRPLVALGSGSKSIDVYSTDPGGSALFSLNDHGGTIRALAFSADGRWLFSGGDEGLMGVWALTAATPKRLAFTFWRGEEWAVVDPDGRFDAANAGNIDSLHWTLGAELVGLSQLKDRYYEPSLLSKLLGLNTERLRDVAVLSAPSLHPDVRLDAIDALGEVRVTLTDQGGGFGHVYVYVNGREAKTIPAEEVPRGPDPKVRTFTISLANDPRLEPGKDNTVVVVA
jgi:WD40 repeat protein